MAASDIKNLVIIAHPSVTSWENFSKIAHHVREAAPEIRPVLLHPKKFNLANRLRLLGHPTMVFSCTKLTMWCRLLPGAIFQGGNLPKSVELSRLREAGIPVPGWTRLTRDYQPDLSEFGPYVVVKPDYGKQGADVWIRRKSRVRWSEPTTRQARLRGNDWIVQEFIYTGKWPCSYRVTTLFGETLWSIKVEAANTRKPLNSRYGFGVDGGRSIVSSGKGCSLGLNFDPEIIALGEKVHEAFPEMPILGVDIIREEPSGKLYVIEVNSPGYTMHFGKRFDSGLEKSCGSTLESQFDGLRKAGRILAEKTLIYAR